MLRMEGGKAAEPKGSKEAKASERGVSIASEEVKRRGETGGSPLFLDLLRN
jgi:hypothetical protein